MCQGEFVERQLGGATGRGDDRGAAWRVIEWRIGGWGGNARE